MEFSSSPDTPPAIRAEARSGKKAPNAVTSLNEKLTASGLRVVLPEESVSQNIERIRKTVVQSLQMMGRTISPSSIGVWKVQDGVYAVQITKEGISSFRRGDGELLLNIAQESRKFFIQNGQALLDAGYVEKKENGEYHLYPISGLNPSGERILWKKLDIKSPEYYHAWEDILFFSWVRQLQYAIQHDLEMIDGELWGIMASGAIKFETLDYLFKKQIISRRAFEVAHIFMRRILPSQCRKNQFGRIPHTMTKSRDPEFLKLWTPIQESDLEQYQKNGYIDMHLMKECLAWLPKSPNNSLGKKRVAPES